MQHHSFIGGMTAAAVKTCVAAIVAGIIPCAAFAGGLGEAVSEPVLSMPAEIVAPAPTGPAAIVTLRGGLGFGPAYPGSDEIAVGPDVGFSFRYLRLGSLEFGNADLDAARSGLSFGGSARYIAPREASDFPELAGLEDLDASFEAGVSLRYTQSAYAVMADVRYGVIGHEGFVADLGVDALLRPSDRLTLRAGPRLFLGDDAYAGTYFGVSPGEAAFSPAFDASGGLLSTGAEVGMSYQFNDDWGLDGAVRYDRLQNDAADSPITQQGSDDQVSARIGVTRNVAFGF